MKIAAQLYTLRDYLKTPEDMAETLKKVKAIGYNAIQASGMGPVEPKAFKEMADEAGLYICATHVPFPDMQNDINSVIEKHKIWDCPYVGVGGMPPEYRGSREGYEKFAKEASEIGRQLNEAGLKFVYHNHEFEFNQYDGKTGMQILFEQSNPETFHFELDVYWVQAGGADPIEWINKVEGRMQVIHLKDMKVTETRGEQLFAEVGEGNMNFKGILEACERTGVEWAPVEQDQCYDRNPFESLEISYKNLIQMGAKA